LSRELGWIKKAKVFDIVERLSIVVFSVSKDIIIIPHPKIVWLKDDIHKKKNCFK